MKWRAAGLALGLVADRVFGDPARHHPVAWFGTAASDVEEHTYADDVGAGGVHVAALLAPLAVGGAVVECAGRRWPALQVAATALTTWAVVGATSLAGEGRMMADALDADDLPQARERLGHLCGRDADALDAPELARATIESMAENTADAAVASIFWGATLGVPGMLVHRAVNTLDAMIGHHNARYERFGKVAARLDDLLDLLPARATGALFATLAPAVGGNARRAWRVLRRDHAKHPSPNGGWCESAMAGALGVQLGGRNIYYGGRVEERGLLGDGARPDAHAVRRSTRLVTLATFVAGGIACAVLGARSAR